MAVTRESGKTYADECKKIREASGVKQAELTRIWKKEQEEIEYHEKIGDIPKEELNIRKTQSNEKLHKGRQSIFKERDKLLSDAWLTAKHGN